MKTTTLLPLLAGSLLLTATAHAQATFSFGPRLGLNVSTARFTYIETSSHAGFEAGLTGNLQLGHFAVQPSLLFSQKGYQAHGGLISYDSPVTYEETVRLNYLTLPLNLAYTLGKAGQGLQVFAGPYLGVLVGGNYQRQVYAAGSYLGGPPSETEYRGKVKAASVFSDIDNRYSQRLDAGLQAGIGYRLKGWQVQAGYSMGLRNLASSYQGYNGTLYREAENYNRAFQVSLSYLVGSKS
jgi:hypothetical protein